MEGSPTEGVRIQPYRPEDAAALYEAALESVTDIFPWLPWCHPRYSMKEAEQWAQSRARLLREGTEYTFVIASDADRFLGGCGLNQIRRDHRLANLGYWVRSSATGLGVAGRAVRQLAEFAFRQTDLIRLEIVCAVDNVRSRRVAEKSGAWFEGVLRDRLILHGKSHDAAMYSIVRSHWTDR